MKAFMFIIVMVVSQQANATWCMKDHNERHIFYWPWDVCPPNTTEVVNTGMEE